MKSDTLAARYSLTFIPCRVPWKPGGINPDDDDHEIYLNKFKNSVLNKLQYLVKKSLEEEPELKSRKKIVEVRIYVCSLIQ